MAKSPSTHLVDQVHEACPHISRWDVETVLKALIAQEDHPFFGVKLVPTIPYIGMARAAGLPWEYPPFPVVYKNLLDAAPDP